jgi:hypothetical protein
MLEHDIQKAVIERVDAKKLVDDRYKWLFAIPNGGKRNIRVAKKLKAEGVRSGVSDLMIPLPVNGFHGAFIEVKTLKGTTSPNQKEFLKVMESRGYFTRVTKGLDETWDVIEKYIEGHFNNY